MAQLLSNQNDIHKRNRILIQYIKYNCNLPCNSKNGRLFHEILLIEWLNSLSRKNATATLSSTQLNFTRDLILKNAWFFFEILLKALAIYFNLKTNFLRANKKSLPQSLPNNQSLNLLCTKQLNQKFLFDLSTLVKALIFEIVNQFSETTAMTTVNSSCLLANGLNCALAFFLYDSMSIIDRGFLFKQIDFYFRETNRGLTHLSNQIKNVSMLFLTGRNTVFERKVKYLKRSSVCSGITF